MNHVKKEIKVSKGYYQRKKQGKKKRMLNAKSALALFLRVILGYLKTSKIYVLKLSNRMLFNDSKSLINHRFTSISLGWSFHYCLALDLHVISRRTHFSSFIPIARCEWLMPLIPKLSGRSLSSRPSWCVLWVPNHLALHTETLSQKKLKKKSHKGQY